MKLIVDIGNTNIVCTVTGSSEITNVLRIETKQSSDVISKTLLSLINSQHIDKAVISSVVPQIDSVIEFAIEKHLGIKPLFITKDICNTLQNIHPELGADRIVNCIAARHLFPDFKNLLVIDYGTATTYDLISKDKFVTGITAPGMKISADALTNNTALLQKIDIDKTNHLMDIKNTSDSIKAGVILGQIGATKHIISEIQNAFGDSKVIATGGLVSLLPSDLFDYVIPNLTLIGLNQF